MSVDMPFVEAIMGTHQFPVLISYEQRNPTFTPKVERVCLVV